MSSWLRVGRSDIGAAFVMNDLRIEKQVQAAETNPLLAEWTGNYGGVPAFDKVKVADFTKVSCGTTILAEPPSPKRPDGSR